MAEACALRDILRLAWDHGHRQICCEMDCADLVAVIEDRKHLHLHSSYRVLIEINHLLSKNWLASLCLISREGNEATYCLARRGSSAVCTGFWCLDYPNAELDVRLAKDSGGVVS